MEETSGAVADAPLKEAPFSELISLWLDEGERLSASAAAAPVPKPATESRLRHVVQQLRPVIERHRLLVLVGIGLLPLALILCIYRGAPAQAAASTIAAAPPVPPSTAPSPPASSAPSPPPSSAQAKASPARAALLASADSADVKPVRHRHHHHHHHHAAGAASKTVASVGRATRR